MQKLASTLGTMGCISLNTDTRLWVRSSPFVFTSCFRMAAQQQHLPRSEVLTDIKAQQRSLHSLMERNAAKSITVAIFAFVAGQMTLISGKRKNHQTKNIMSTFKKTSNGARSPSTPIMQPTAASLLRYFILSDRTRCLSGCICIPTRGSCDHLGACCCF